jgi:hypothetical protein
MDPGRSPSTRNPHDIDCIDFSLFRSAFRSSPGQLVLDEGYACGTLVLATLKGRIDLAHDDVDVAGGLLVGSRHTLDTTDPPDDELGSSLVTVYLRAKGPAGAPALQLNPFPALMPGRRALLNFCRQARSQR